MCLSCQLIDMFPWIIFTDYILSHYDLNFVSVFEKCSCSYLPTKSTPDFLKSFFTRDLELRSALQNKVWGCVCSWQQWYSLMTNSVFALYTNKYVLPSTNAKKNKESSNNLTYKDSWLLTSSWFLLSRKWQNQGQLNIFESAEMISGSAEFNLIYRHIQIMKLLQLE
jgi:hypothetical protein